MEQATNKKEVVYKKAKLGKRMLAYFIDVGLLIMTTLIMLSIINIPITNSNWYKSKQDELIQLRNDSGIYEDGINIVDYTADNSRFDSYEKKNEFLSMHIDAFYRDTTYFNDLNKIKNEYESRKINAKKDGVNLFVQDDGKVVENAVSPEWLYDFYVEEIQNYTLAYLMRNTNYFYLTRFSFLVTVVEFVSLFTLFFTVYFLILPLTCFKRGRQTIGMKLEKIGIISVKAVNVTTGKYIGRFVFNYFVFFILDFVGFLIPAVVSITMMYVNKTNSNLTNYVFNDYAVDAADKTIYLNALEREESEFKLQEISIENKDFTLK